MKQERTQFGLALKLSEARQQVAELQAQNTKLATEVRMLRESDRALFDAQGAMIDALQDLVRDLVEGLQDCWDNEYSLNELNDLKARAQALLQGEEKVQPC